MQPLICIKHNFTFQGLLSNVVNRKQEYILRCKKCVKSALLSEKPLIGYNFFKPENRWALELRLTNRRYPQHTLLATKGTRMLMHCSVSDKKFVATLFSEIGQGATGCVTCRDNTLKERNQKINLSKADYYASTNSDPRIIYTEKGKVCKAHETSWPCRICSPYRAVGINKLELQGLTPATATLSLYRESLKHSNELILEEAVKSRNLKVEGTSIKVCEHKTLDASNISAQVSRDLFCDICDVVEPAKSKFVKLYPKIVFSDFKSMTTTTKKSVSFLLKVVGGGQLIFNTTSGTIRKHGGNQVRVLPSPVKLNEEDNKMALRLTVKDVKVRIETRHPSVTVIGVKLEWGQSLPVKLRHTCGNVWVTTMNNVMASKVGCPTCARKQATDKNSSSVESAQARVDNSAGNGIFKVLRLEKGDLAYRYFPVLGCSTCSSTFLQRWDTKISCPVCSPSVTGPRSKVCWEWLSNLERIFKIKIVGCNSPEITLTVKGKKFRVDGYHKESETVFEFLGDYWHGNPKSFPEHAEKYRKTIERLTALHEKYNVIYVWESGYKKDLRSFSGFMSHGTLPFLFPAQLTPEK